MASTKSSAVDPATLDPKLSAYSASAHSRTHSVGSIPPNSIEVQPLPTCWNENSNFVREICTRASQANSCRSIDSTLAGSRLDSYLISRKFAEIH